jgi:hypothetical protein
MTMTIGRSVVTWESVSSPVRKLVPSVKMWGGIAPPFFLYSARTSRMVSRNQPVVRLPYQYKCVTHRDDLLTLGP